MLPTFFSAPMPDVARDPQLAAEKEHSDLRVRLGGDWRLQSKRPDPTPVFGALQQQHGGALVFEDHFVKTGPDSLGLARAFSAGPAATLDFPFWSLALRLPITGAFGKGSLEGPYGPTLHLERDWEISPSIRISLSAEGSYHLWNAEAGPNSTVTECSVGLGPKVILR